MWKYCILIVAFFSIYLCPAPEGLKPDAWKLFAVYVAAILGIILRPQKDEPAVLLVVIAFASLFVPLGKLLSGFSTSVVWLVFSAFLISQAFIETGLGQRLGSILIGKFGKSTLGLAYAAALTDLLISPATPSNTARTGGIVYPIFRSVAATLGSEPGPTGRRAGAYITLTMYQISLITAGMFITACAPNILSANFAKDVFGIEISWLLWMQAGIVPGLLALFLAPLIVYKMYPPELKEIENYKEIAAERLKAMGPMSSKEKLLVIFFVLAIVGWATGSITKINTTTVALIFFALGIVCNLFTWDSVLKNRSAWSTLIWFGGIIGVSGALAGAGFFTWLAAVMQKNLDFTGVPPILTMFILLVLSLASRYLFASMTAFVAAFVPVIMTLGLAANVPAYPMSLLLGYSAAFGALLTHYGGSCGPVLFGTGYVDQPTWWKVGLAIVIMNVAVYMVVGLPCWKLMGLW